MEYSTPGFIEPEVIAVSQDMCRILTICDFYATLDEPVLVSGETGTGKELICRRLHARSHRRSKPFIAVNCAAIPHELFERELFGHARGAYTGANNHGDGLLDQAAGGTLFLDELGDLSPAMQPKLLRLLDRHEYYRVGDSKMRTIDVRIVGATNRDLLTSVEDGSFRADLRYRMIGLDIVVPPLRKRRKDIIPLLHHFLCQLVRRQVAVADYLSQHEIECVCRSPWRGNARELRALARKLSLRHVLDCLEPEIRSILAARDHRRLQPFRPSRSELVTLLSENGGNKSQLSQSLGVARSTLYRWLRQEEPEAERDLEVLNASAN